MSAGLLNRIGFVFARQWIAGIDIPSAIRSAGKANSQGEHAILNYLGESYRDERDIRKSVSVYMRLLDRMKSSGIRGSISVKPTQLGILRSAQEFARNCGAIASRAERLGFFVWIDMEEFGLVQGTIGAYAGMLARHGNIGICLQAKLRRSEADAVMISALRGSIRVVKGAYAGPEGTAYSDPEDIRRNFVRIAETCLRRRSGLMAATHDEILISRVMRLERRYKRRAQFGMLNGIRPRLAKRLAGSGEKVSVYMPFGEDWAGYSLRRLREEGHAMLVIRSVFQR